jgi:hypothetical protein
MEVVAKLPSAEQREGDLKLLLKALSAFRRGESGVTLPSEWDGLYGKIAAEFNELTAQTGRTSQKLKAHMTAVRSSDDMVGCASEPRRRERPGILLRAPANETSRGRVPRGVGGVPPRRCLELLPGLGGSPRTSSR